MKKIVLTLVRAAVLIAAVVLMQDLLMQMRAMVNKTYNYLPYAICVPLASTLLGMLLRSDIFFAKGLRFRVDWPGLLLIGLPSLLIASSYFIWMYVIPYVKLPDFVTRLFWGDITALLGGVVFGYTLVNSLFAVKSPDR